MKSEKTMEIRKEVGVVVVNLDQKIRQIKFLKDSLIRLFEDNENQLGALMEDVYCYDELTNGLLSELMAGAENLEGA